MPAAANQHLKSSLLSVHLAVLLLGGTAQFSKLVPLSAVDITFGRSLIALLCLIGMVKYFGENLRLKSAKSYAIGALLGLLMSGHWVSYFLGMQLAGVATGIIALFTFPVMTVFIEPLFERSKPHWYDILSAVSVFIGIVIMVPEVSLKNDATLGIFLGICSAVCYAVRNVVHRHYFSQYSGSQAMAFQVLIVIFSLIFFVSDDFYQADVSSWLMLIVLGSFFTALPHALVASALRSLSAKTFSLITCLQPFYATVFAMILLAEFPTWQTWLGGSIIVSAAIFETVKTAKTAKATKTSEAEN